MFSTPTVTELIAEYVVLHEKPAYARISTATCGVLLTAAQIINAPLDNMITAVMPDAFAGMNTNDVEADMSRFRPASRDTDRCLRTFVVTARLRAWLLDRHMQATLSRRREFACMTAYDLMHALQSLLLRNYFGMHPTSTQLWNELIKDGQGPMDPDDLFDISVAFPYLCSVWMRLQPDTVCSIREIVFLLSRVATSLIIVSRGRF